MTEELTQTAPADDPAIAFEELRRAVSLTRAAVEGLTAARERIPDYSDTLGEMLAVQKVADDRLSRIERSPAISLSPAAMAAEIVKASEAARAADQKQMHEARDEMLRAIGRIDTIVDHGRAAHQQRHLLISTGVAAAAGAMLLMAILPGAIARSLPASWHVPEWMAARTMGLDQREAGKRMISTARRESASRTR
ncbi:hypothetical protein DAH66_09815 [Sphingomonas koreensis]|uniref:Uncharacterized protein n=1 Tax=Sphingomonas koreensis TaxID=93064 RepID=A0A430G488_9SPHN|nr:DUF6118 family protein [Sphingomonas koreensis]RSY85979.1 hypothetical protein DAH66_09815 [Sphingomonas koreensis]